MKSSISTKTRPTCTRRPWKIGQSKTFERPTKVKVVFDIVQRRKTGGLISDSVVFERLS